MPGHWRNEGSTALGLRVAYIMIALVVVATASVAAVILMGHPWMESAQAVTEPAITESAVTQPAVTEAALIAPATEKGNDPDAQPLKPNTEAKGDRLMAPTPPPGDANAIGPPSLSLESARQYLAAPSAGVKFRTVMRPKPIPVLLDDKQIASLKRRLKLTAAQEKFWPPVESALREVVLYLYNQRKQPSALDQDNDAVKRLVAAATPFLAHLRDDQKSEIQSLARMAGLGSELPGQKAAQN
ncbi:MAG: hypothetical protein K2X60_03955 [Xanthobacteraceae bacterium]|nr:hypothetical protein [Xanthobacteraceae bacterium]